MNNVILSEYIQPVFETESNKYSEWFGYYNYDTLNHDHSRLLCNRAAFDGIKPQKGMSIELGYYDISTRSWIKIGESDSWNWQQGAMLQWLPGDGNEDKVIYNTSKEGHLISRIHDISTGENLDLLWPIYGLTPDGKKSITIDFERSYWCRAYHYQSVTNADKEGRVCEQDGIFELDLIKNEVRKLIPIQKVIDLDAEPDFPCMKHWLEHVMISPDGSKFVFLHRYSPEDNIFSYKTRVCIANIDGSNLQILSGTDAYERTHFGWAPDNSFAIYSYKHGYFSGLEAMSVILSQRPISVIKVFKRLYLSLAIRLPRKTSNLLSGIKTYYQIYTPSNDSYVLDTKKTRTSFYPIDGHPSFTKDGKYIITDSYPDKNKYQHLIIHNMENGKTVELARIYAYYMGSPASCDLHPKLCKDNNFLVVDTAYNTKHHMLMFEIDWRKITNEID